MMTASKIIGRVEPRFSLTDRLFRFVAQSVARLIYRVTAFGEDELPERGFLLLPNHLTWVDAIVLQLACPRPIRFVVYEDIFNLPLLNPLFRAVGAFPISAKRARDTV